VGTFRPAALLLAAALASGGPVMSQSAPLALAHVNVIDGTSASIQRNMTVTISDGRISAIEPSPRARVPQSARVIDASGKYLIPGLWDMHVHWYDDRFVALFVANGVTSVRQMWGMPLHLTWRDRIGRGELLGPRFVIASPIVDGPNPVWPRSIVVRDEIGARQAVRGIKRMGYDFVKVYDRLPRDAYVALLEEARRQDLSVSGHVPMSVRAADASDAGQKTIEHLSGVLYGVSRAEEDLGRRNIELSKGGEASTGIEPAIRTARRELRERLLATYDAAKAKALFATFVKNGTWQCPTLTVIRSIASLDDPAFTRDTRLRYMPRSVVESWQPRNNPRLATKTAADYALDRRIYRKQLEIVGAMHRAGVKFLAGTDVLNPYAFPGFSLHDELALLVEAGLSPVEALQAATVNPAAYHGVSDRLGTIARGKVADLVVLDASPLDNISNTKRIAAVIVAGRLLQRTELNELLEQAETTASLK
jgi:imidazolonepropionase-like amidohydrolase